MYILESNHPEKVYECYCFLKEIIKDAFFVTVNNVSFVGVDQVQVSLQNEDVEEESEDNCVLIWINLDAGRNKYATLSSELSKEDIVIKTLFCDDGKKVVAINAVKKEIQAT